VGTDAARPSTGETHYFDSVAVLVVYSLNRGSAGRIALDEMNDRLYVRCCTLVWQRFRFIRRPARK